MRFTAATLSSAALALIIVLATPSGARAGEAEAKDLLKAMSDYLARQKAISFAYDTNLEVVTKEHQKALSAQRNDGRSSTTASVMIFQHDEPPILVASFLQNSTQRVEEASEAEVILPAVPDASSRPKKPLEPSFPRDSSSPLAHWFHPKASNLKDA